MHHKWWHSLSPHQNKNGFAQRISSFSIPNFQHREFNQMKMGRCTKSNLRYVFLEKFTFFANVGIMINFTRQAGLAKQLASDGYHCIAVELHCIVIFKQSCLLLPYCQLQIKQMLFVRLSDLKTKSPVAPILSAANQTNVVCEVEWSLNRVAFCSHIVSFKSNKCCL